MLNLGLQHSPGCFFKSPYHCTPKQKQQRKRVDYKGGKTEKGAIYGKAFSQIISAAEFDFQHWRMVIVAKRIPEVH